MNLPLSERDCSATFNFFSPVAPLAQLAEQLTLNQRVIGSSPIRGIPSLCTVSQVSAPTSATPHALRSSVDSCDPVQVGAAGCSTVFCTLGASEFAAPLP